MRTKDDMLSIYKDKSVSNIKTEDLVALTEALKLEVLIDIRDILDKTMLELYRGLRAIPKQP